MTNTTLSSYGLGKFSLNVDAYIYAESADRETGDCEHGGWYGLYRGPFEPTAEERAEFSLTPDDVEYLATLQGAILCEDSQGFVQGDHYDGQTYKQIKAVWRDIETTLAEYYAEGN